MVSEEDYIGWFSKRYFVGGIYFSDVGVYFLFGALLDIQFWYFVVYSVWCSVVEFCWIFCWILNIGCFYKRSTVHYSIKLQ